MALALNTYKTITGIVTTGAVGIYTAPTGYSAIVLLAQATNVGNDTQTITFSYQANPPVGAAVTTEMLQDFPVPAMMLQIFWQENLFLKPVILLWYHQVV